MVTAFGMMMSYAIMAHHAYQQIGFAMVKVIVQMAVMKQDVTVKKNVRAINFNVAMVTAFGMPTSDAIMDHNAYQQNGFAMVKMIVQTEVMKSNVMLKYQLLNDQEVFTMSSWDGVGSSMEILLDNHCQIQFSNIRNFH